MSIRRKMVLATVVAFLLPLIAWLVFVFQTMNERIYSVRFSSARRSLEHIGTSLTRTLDDCAIYANQISGNKDVLNLVQRANTDGEIVETYNLKLKPLIDSILVQNAAIHTIHIVHENPSIFNTYDLLYRVEDIDAYIREIYKGMPRAQENNVQYYENAPVLAFFDVNRQEHGVWYVYSVIRSPSFYRAYGIVEAVIDREALYSQLDAFRRGEGETLSLIRDGRVIYGDAVPAETGDGRLVSDDVERRGNTYFITLALPEMEADLVYTVAGNSLKLTGTEWRLIAVLTAVSILCMLLLTRMVHTILRRLTKLSDRMDEAARGDRIDVRDGDEIDRLNEHFGHMLSRLAYVSETEKKLMFNELTNNLQPHFMCNAMDMLQLQAEGKGQEEIAKSVRQISQYFRYSMLREREGVTLMSEIDDARNYMELINAMRKNPVRFTVSLDDWTERNADRMTVPKMLLQPLTDNAVRHGIRAEAMGVVSIDARYTDGALHLRVSDNGSGMTEQEEAYLRNLITSGAKEAEAGRHVGIANVIMRLEILYQNRYRLDFETGKTGTVFELILQPLLLGEAAGSTSKEKE